MKVAIANWRWNGTPFYLRTGKRMKARVSEIAVRFKEPPHSIFDADAGTQRERADDPAAAERGHGPARDDQGTGAGRHAADRGAARHDLRRCAGPEDGADVPDAYERLIMDVIRGNQTLFMRGDEVEAAWAWTDPIIEGWEARGDRPRPYDPGTRGRRTR
jgi:glucose-6-phosphate 1-dehydrogenase